MITRVRWYSVGSLDRPLLEQIASAMLRAKYAPNAKMGYSLTNVRPDSIEGKFIERIELRSELIDPFGNKTEFTRLRYKQVPFLLSVRNAALELYDSPRGVKTLFNHLSKLSSRLITISAPEVNVMEWMTRIGKLTNGLVVKSMLIGDIPLSSTASARAMVKGSDDIREQVKLLLGNRIHNIEKVEIAWGSENHRSQCEIHQNGRADLISGEQKDMLAILRKTIVLAPQTP